MPPLLATNPVKFYEYISSGKPVVSVALPELMQYNENCYLADGKEDFLRKIEIALSEKNDVTKTEKRIALARENSWHSRYTELVVALKKL